MKSSKKITAIFLTLFVLVLALTALTACDEGVNTVTFDSNGGTAVNSVGVANGGTVAAPETPVKEGYVFAGWEGEGGIWDFTKPVSSDMTLVAKWEKSEDADIVSVVFDSCGGSPVATVDVSRGTVVGAPTAPARPGYAFSGWTQNGEAYNFALALVNDIELKAEWTIIEYSVSYDMNGGTNDRTNPVEFNAESETLTIKDPVKSGYNFLGWTYEGSEVPKKALTLPTGSVGNKVYTANWELIEYTISYDYAGGTGESAPVDGYNVTSETFSIPDPVKAQYEFLGWTYEGADAPQKALTIAKGSTGNLSLVANWAPVQYTINYVLDGGTNSPLNPATYSHETALTLAEPARAGYKFLGWTYDGVSEPTKTVSITAGTTGDKTYSANWEIVTYNITYNINEGGSVSGDPFTETFTVLDLPLNVESAFTEGGTTFAGWYLDSALTSKCDVITECTDITLYASFKPASEGIVFEEYFGGYAVAGYNGTDEVVYIPEIYNGAPVIAIKEAAFKGNNTVKEVYLPYGIMEIGVNAFANATALEAVHARPDGAVYVIDRNAFAGCTSLESVTIPASVEEIKENAFLSCTALSEVTFAYGSSLKELGASAFESCISLKSIALPAGISKVADRTFYMATALESVSFADGTAVSSIGDSAFYANVSLSSIVIPANVTEINASAFQGATALSDLSFEDGSLLAVIGEKAFYNCDSLVTVQMPDTLHTISASAFAYSDKLETIVFTSSSELSTLGASAFYNCKSFKSIALPNTLESIGASAFYYCTSLSSLTIGNRTKTIGRTAFYNCSSLTSLTLPASISTIDKDAFRGCTGIKYLNVGNAAKIKTVFGGQLPVTLEELVITGGSAIEEAAFAGCVNLHTVSLPFVGTSTAGGELYKIFGDDPTATPASLENVTITGNAPITSGAFRGAASIKKLVISPSVTSIGSAAFYGCRNLEYLEVSMTSGSTLEYMYESIPTTLKTVKLTVPDETSTAITANALKGSYVTTVILDSQISRIGSSAFEGIATLEKIVIPEGSALSNIGSKAFKSCIKLSEIEFTGNYIKFDSYAFADSGLVSIKFASGSRAVLSEGIFDGCAKLESFDIIAARVTEIPENAFANCVSLTSIVIADGVTSIGAGAFENCTSLKTVEIGGESLITEIGERAFKNTAVDSIFIPDGVAVIAPSTFDGCVSLASVSFGDASVLTEIGANAFRGTAIEAIALPATLETIQESAFANAEALASVSFGENSALAKISTSAFENCTSLTSIVIPKGVSVIALNTFKNCKALTTVSFEDGSVLSSVLAHAFEGCSRLNAITLPATVASIGEYAFAQCFSLETLVFADGSVLEAIDAYAFYNCDSLVSVSFPATLVTIGEKAFFTCDALETVTFADGSVIEVLPAYVFANCVSLRSVNIPDSLKTIEEGAFSGCSALEELVISDSSTLVNIGANALRDCSSLTSFNVPATVEFIGKSAFAGCTALESITLSTDIDVIEGYLFLDCANLEITVNHTGDASVPAGWDSTWNSEEKAVTWVDVTASV